MSKMEPRYVIGIDLGTTNSALAYVEYQPDADPFAQPRVELLGIPQLVNPAEVRDEDLLPSFLYIPGATDFPAGATALPWDPQPETVAGRLAQKRGVENAGRLVSSAKSWLSHGGVDRTAPLLPFRAPEGVPKYSPVEASRRYLDHLRHAWDNKMPDAPFTEQHVLVTVPASFDAVARDLTLKAAEQAGYQNVTLLEEPQAAFYAWIERHPDWRERVAVGDLILVVDIGGGTTDFTLIAVTEQGGELTLERVAVGEHILLGGDNIDLALARLVADQLAQAGHQDRQLPASGAVEQLPHRQGEAARPRQQKGRSAGDHSGEGHRSGGRVDQSQAAARRSGTSADATAFCPPYRARICPRGSGAVGLQEIGLPYAADAAITRHLARFLRQQASTAEHGGVRRGPSGLACPTHMLFNGGVLNAALIRERLLGVLNSWLAEEGLPPVKPLSGEDLMHAVSRGAAYYGLARRGRGVRIRGGVPRTYYVAIESAMPSVPGFAAPLKALTVVPFGMEEGTDLRIPNREFGLVVGEPAEFRFFTSAVRKNDQPGDLIEDFGDELEELAPMEVNLPAEQNAADVVPVSFETVVTETGMLQLWCVARDGRRWKLEFNVRERIA